ncbi:unnamed protein product [Vitrella brassicaformis CCMP3155]|uniref:Uncharacterized protein n=3 Tax=Vitrella brassicaformis TaxID=1169539 RepID=A0A0G4GYD0_VITBC|nr:unnamed protein product [Vitrella brassicaformis CCMP3155]|eukprot:CEM36114.1 unnamed protein product [Vitrella brassicaformis CCMP3155]
MVLLRLSVKGNGLRPRHLENLLAITALHDGLVSLSLSTNLLSTYPRGVGGVVREAAHTAADGGPGGTSAPDASGHIAVLADVIGRLRALDLSGNYLTEKGVRDLFELLLSRDSQLWDLNLASTQLFDGMSALGQYLATPQCPLFKLDLSYNFLATETFRTLVAALRQNRQLRILKLVHCGLKEDSIRILANADLTHCGLQSLNLERNRLGPSAMLPLAKALTSPWGQQTLAHINLSHNDLSDPDRHLAEAFERYPPEGSVRRLELRNTRLAFDADLVGVQPSIVRALRTGTSVSSLDVSENDFSPAIVQALAKGATHLTELTFNKTSRAILFIDGLKKELFTFPTKAYQLNKLSLSGCELRDEGASLLSDVLLANQKRLKSLSFDPQAPPRSDAPPAAKGAPVSSPPSARTTAEQQTSQPSDADARATIGEAGGPEATTDDGAAAAAAAAAPGPASSWSALEWFSNALSQGARVASHSIQVLSLSHNGITARGLLRLLRWVKDNRHLKVLQLSHNKLKTEGAKYLAAMLKDMTENGMTYRLSYLGVGSCALGSQGALSLVQSAAPSPVQKLDISGNFIDDSVVPAMCAALAPPAEPSPPTSPGRSKPFAPLLALDVSGNPGISPTGVEAIAAIALAAASPQPWSSLWVGAPDAPLVVTPKPVTSNVDQDDHRETGDDVTGELGRELEGLMKRDLWGESWGEGELEALLSDEEVGRGMAGGGDVDGERVHQPLQMTLDLSGNELHRMGPVADLQHLLGTLHSFPQEMICHLSLDSCRLAPLLADSSLAHPSFINQQPSGILYRAPPPPSLLRSIASSTIAPPADRDGDRPPSPLIPPTSHTSRQDTLPKIRAHLKEAVHVASMTSQKPYHWIDRNGRVSTMPVPATPHRVLIDLGHVPPRRRVQVLPDNSADTAAVSDVKDKTSARQSPFRRTSRVTTATTAGTTPLSRPSPGRSSAAPPAPAPPYAALRSPLARTVPAPTQDKRQSPPLFVPIFSRISLPATDRPKTPTRVITLIPPSPTPKSRPTSRARLVGSSVRLSGAHTPVSDSPASARRRRGAPIEPWDNSTKSRSPSRKRGPHEGEQPTWRSPLSAADGSLDLKCEGVVMDAIKLRDSLIPLVDDTKGGPPGGYAGLLGGVVGGMGASLAGPVAGSLRSMVLRRCELDDRAVKMLCDCLREFPSLTALDISQNKIGHLGCRSLRAVLSEGTRDLRASQTCLSNEERRDRLSETLTTSLLESAIDEPPPESRMGEVRARTRPSTARSTEGRRVGRYVHEDTGYPRLRELRLDGNSIRANGLQSLFDGILLAMHGPRGPSLRFLSVCDNQITYPGGFLAAKFLSFPCCPLLSFEMASNPIGATGIVAILQTVASNPRLQEVDLSFCGAEPFVGLHIADCLNGRSSLRRLRMLDPSLTDDPSHRELLLPFIREGRFVTTSLQHGHHTLLHHHRR